MTRYRFNPHIRSAVAAALLAASAVPVIAVSNALPEPQRAGDVRYLTGGVGLEESQAILEHRRDYPLAVEVYAKEDGREVYTAGTSVNVSTPSGDSILQAQADGPFLLADVAPGRYTVEVTREGQTQRKSVTVGRDGTSRAIFVFREQT